MIKLQNVILGLIYSVGAVALFSSILVWLLGRSTEKRFKIVSGRTTAPDSDEWRDLTKEEIEIMNKDLKVLEVVKE